MVKKKKKSEEIPELSFEDDMEENGFVDGVPTGENIFRTFSFAPEEIKTAQKPIDVVVPTTTHEDEKIKTSTEIVDNRILKTIGNEKTPEVDNEPFDINRSYKLRKSTARMLNEIKAIHPNVNVYMNTIVDAALRHYYNYIFNENGELH
ncbi:hypothetical protein [Clostridium fungisolvens]|uniref:DUF3408 domain-containing protein n=1 Tax=Clostridium fungisolvens TaxID=1604897 RepID=A0A6V8SIR1_9CLOT|nr:hypothetical protein [Clostridium fungisolvens]GFP76405.1 hypothetical protein bsdtw1_02507 [Clostridium fungisolvens]